MDNTKPKLILLDIDGTLFDSKGFRKAFKELILKRTGADPETFEEIEEKVYSSFSIFEPGSYLSMLLGKLNKPDLFEEVKIQVSNEPYLETFLYDDVLPFVETVSPGSRVGILSRGDPSMQEAKIRRIKGFLDPDKVYILPDKINSADQIVGLNRDFKVFFVDDTREVLEAYKKEDSSWTTILIEREEVKEYNGSSDFKVPSLNEALECINK